MPQENIVQHEQRFKRNILISISIYILVKGAQSAHAVDIRNWVWK
jgi:hypothetical protein